MTEESTQELRNALNGENEKGFPISHVDADDVVDLAEDFMLHAGMSPRQAQLYSYTHMDRRPHEKGQIAQLARNLGLTRSTARTQKKNAGETEHHAHNLHYMVQEPRPKSVIGTLGYTPYSSDESDGKELIIICKYHNTQTPGDDDSFPEYALIFEKFEESGSWSYGYNYTGSDVERFETAESVKEHIMARLDKNDSRLNRDLVEPEAEAILGISEEQFAPEQYRLFEHPEDK